MIAYKYNVWSLLGSQASECKTGEAIPQNNVFMHEKCLFSVFFFYVFIRFNEIERILPYIKKKIKKTFMRLIPNQQKLPTAKVRDTYHMYTTVPLYVQFNTKK